MVHNSTSQDNESVGFREPSKTGEIVLSTQASFLVMANFLVAFFCSPATQIRNPHNRCILSLAIADILTSISVITNPIY